MNGHREHDKDQATTAACETPSHELDLPEGVPLNGNREDDDASSQASDEGASALSSVFTLCNSCIGAGVLSLPFAFMKAGASISEINRQLQRLKSCPSNLPWMTVNHRQDRDET